MSWRERYLLRLLTGIFIVQGIILVSGLSYCFKDMEKCPKLGQRTDQWFNVAIATTLSMLAAGKVGPK